MLKRNQNVKFIDYHFDITPDGTIIMDKELTLKHIHSSVGDLYIVMINDDGCIQFVPCDVSDALDDEDYQDLNFN